MAWNLTGQMIEACSCKMLCPCNFGPAEPDQGWCSAALAFDVQQGSSDGVDLAGCKVALAADLPGDYFTGNATARLYLDSAATEEQRGALEAIFTGKRGGNWEAFNAAAVSKWLSPKTASISVASGDNPAVSVGDVGKLTLQPVKTQSGKPARLLNGPLGELFGESEDIAFSTGSQWSDPDMRAWKAGGSGGIIQFSWSA